MSPEKTPSNQELKFCQIPILMQNCELTMGGLSFMFVYTYRKPEQPSQPFSMILVS